MEKLRVLVLEVERLRDLGLAMRSLVTAEILDWLDLGDCVTLELQFGPLVGEETELRVKLLPTRGMVLSLTTAALDPTSIRLSPLSRE